MKLRDLLPKINPAIDIEFRLFDITLVVTVCFFLFWSVFSLFADYTPIIKLIYWVAFAIYFSMYVGYRIGGSFRWYVTIYYSSILGLLALSWLPAGGIDGPIIIWFFLAYISGLMVLPQRIYGVFVVISLAILIVFSFVELANPGIAPVYTSTQLRLQDLVLASVITLLLSGLSLLVFKRAYLADRKKMEQLIKELEGQKLRAESADRAKTQFLATISHEMRTPLNGIVGLTELLTKTPLSTEQVEMISNLQISSRQLHSIISDVLDLTLIEDSKLIINEYPVKIREEIETVMGVVAPRLSPKADRLSLLLDYDSTIPDQVYGDGVRLRQILINLVTNAIKFTEQGSVLIKTQLARKTPENVWIKFRVTDTGPGIPEDKQDHIFGKFFKARENPQSEGTGLGLSISKHLVHLLHGKIGFESTLGVGTTFFFELPFALNTDQAAESIPALETPRFETLKILLAEDTAINQLVAKKMLHSLGINQVHIVENGLQAVEIARQKSFDIILMDIQMPEMNGIEAATLILHEQRETPPVIIALTANVMTTDLEACKAAGMLDFISKPFQSETLSATLSKYVTY